jgi:peptide/nickel transport system substrate-binding protein
VVLQSPVALGQGWDGRVNGHAAGLRRSAVVRQNGFERDLLTGALKTTLSRRAILRRAGALGLGVAVASPLLAACGGEDNTPTPAPAAATPTPAAAATTAPGTEATPTTAAEAPTPTQAAGGDAQTGGTWTLVLAQEPDTLDAHKTGAYVSGVVHRYIGDALVAKDVEKELHPGLSENYEVSDDGLTWTFTLRDGITFHDGATCDANAVKACFDRAIDPATVSAVTIGQLGPIDSVNVIDAKTVEFVHKEVFALFLDNMAHPVTSIINAEAATAAGDQYGRNPVCTGPWKFVEWQAANQIVVERFADYNWGPDFAHDGPAYIERLIFRFMPEPQTLVTAFEVGEVNQIEIPQPDIQRIKDTGQYETIEFYRPGATFIEFNVTKPPFDDVHVRRALNYAVRREPLLEIGLEGYGQLLYGPLPPSIWGYWEGMEDYAYKHDPEKAMEEFAEAGWTRQGNGPLMKDGQPFTFTIVHSGNEPANKATQVLQSQLQEYGIDMQIQTFEFTTLLADLKAGNYEVSVIGYAYASPDILHIWFHSSNINTGLTLSHYSNPELDRLIEASREEIDPDKRLVIYEDIQKLIVDNAIWIPLWAASTTYGLHKRIAGHYVHPDGHLHLFEAHLTDL